LAHLGGIFNPPKKGGLLGGPIYPLIKFHFPQMGGSLALRKVYFPILGSQFIFPKNEEQQI